MACILAANEASEVLLSGRGIGGPSHVTHVGLGAPRRAGSMTISESAFIRSTRLLPDMISSKGHCHRQLLVRSAVRG